MGEPPAALERAVGLEHDPAAVAASSSLAVVERAEVDLVDHGRHVCPGDESLKPARVVVGDADRARQAPLVKPLEVGPDRVARPGGPVDQVEVDPVETQPREAPVSSRWGSPAPGVNFVVTKTSSRGSPVRPIARPTPSSLR